ncbi:MAG: 2-dehydropantoate 2-reductase [Levilactobacillus sp.]|jgi:2-dehydropantoate 2-reductase|uniref:ketopantoate reductase family protein n=1 Tax=Levilactobacillus sp. TaxID=2767919 RepID=UPI00258340E9|nr:2-dehydropantoate 2-reductase [Levilactobacillus sp.]MCI1552928.1 2-dehydropantoate 2-reductase [Levilactobacillus sp.]MCI1598068.1 2-dehydropantoate 2-reductase [Levilactobacillus sp.]MCI1606566.1 2-dehydropantoate 2-reductase [Levilactobacillus sp.]
MKIAIAGAGAMGCRFGVKLQSAGNQVTLIDNWAAHVAAINQQGLTVTTDDGTDHIYHLTAVAPQAVTGEFDLVILFTKAMQMDQMLQDISGILGNHPAVLTLANGIGNVETIERHVPKSQIVVGTTVWSSGMPGPGHIKVTGTGSISLQAVVPTEFADFSGLLTTLNAAGLNASQADNVMAAIWKKAGLNSVLNTYCTLFDCNIGEFGALPNWRALNDAVLNEFEAVAQAAGIAFSAQDVTDLIAAQFSPETNGGHYPSMHQDMAHQRPTEIDFLNGYVAKLGAQLQVPAPTNAILAQEIHAQEALKGIS